jgi:hypothetical protein
MGEYGEAAVRAARLSQHGKIDPVKAWWKEIRKANLTPKSQDKGCPRYSFLGLCEDGFVANVKKGNYTRSVDSKRYAIAAVRILRAGNGWSGTKTELWKKVQKACNTSRSEQGELQVVLALWGTYVK